MLHLGVAMKKAKFDEGKKFISVLLVPHSKGEVKMFKISSLYAKLYAFAALILTVCICASIFAACIIRENRMLKETVSELYNTSVEQRNLLSEKANEIKQLKSMDRNLDKTINDFMNKYREITDTYISNRMGSNLSSRSGDRSPSSFADEINELKAILHSINELNSSGICDLTELHETENKLREYLDSIPTFWPATGRISDKFGYRTHPIRKTRLFHEGIDISVPHGADVKAAASGTVIFSGNKNGYGNLVQIDHGYGITTAYGHNSKNLVKEGQKVNKGEVIAKAGSTGVSTGPHIHFEVRLNGTPVDPLRYLDSK
jgi:murein DD-endopeptidase MepM/ murein hydrolase activator NlpD